MWFKNKGENDLERELGGLRQEPSSDLVADVTGRVGSAPRRIGSRAAFAGALITLVLGTFASFGGVGYAAAGASQTVKSVYKISSSAAAPTSARDQYQKKPANVAKVSAKHVVVVKKTHPAKTVAKATTLPFTGFSLLLSVGLSLGLIVLGFMLRRRESYSKS